MKAYLPSWVFYGAEEICNLEFTVVQITLNLLL